LCPCSGFTYPRIRTFVEKYFHGLFSKKKVLKSGGFVSGGFVVEMKLRSISSALQNCPDETLGLLENRGKIWRYGRS